jgi:biopolymer transport protein ExbB
MLHFILQVNTVVATAADTLKNNAVTGIQTAATPEITETKISLIEMIWKGGPIMIPLALMLLITVFVLVERLLVIGKASKSSPGLIPSLKEMIHSGNIANARSMCKNNNTPESTMVEQGVARIGQPVQEIRGP